MATFGLGNFLYEFVVKDGKAHFNFWDNEDAENTAEVVLSEKDFGGHPASSRQVADTAFAQASKVLNDKRDARIHKQASADLAEKQTEDARVREAADDFLHNATDVSATPTQVEEDGTKVYNTETSDTESSDKKSK